MTRGVGHEVKGGAQHGGVLAKGDHARDGERAGGAEGALDSVLALDGVCGGEDTTGGFLAEDERRRGGGADAHEAVHLVRRIALPVTELRHRDGRDVGREVGTRLGGAGRGGASGEDLGDERNPRGARRRASRNASRRRAPPRRLIRGAATSRRERARVGEGRGGRGGSRAHPSHVRQQRRLIQLKARRRRLRRVDGPNHLRFGAARGDQ